jgi:hypothetical protein
MVLPEFGFLSAIQSPIAILEQDYCLNHAAAGKHSKDLFATNLYTVACARRSRAAAAQLPTPLERWSVER